MTGQDLFVGERDGVYMVTAGTYTTGDRTQRPEYTFLEGFKIVEEGGELRIMHQWGAINPERGKVTTLAPQQRNLAELLCRNGIIDAANRTHSKMREDPDERETELINLFDPKEKRRYLERIGEAEAA